MANVIDLFGFRPGGNRDGGAGSGTRAGVGAQAAAPDLPSHGAGLCQAHQAVSVCHRDWTNQELANLYRVHDILLRAGAPVETGRGVSDEGEPWFVFCDHHGDVFIHLCRIDGCYLLDSPNIDAPLTGSGFNALVDAFVERAGLPASGGKIARLRPGEGIYLHPTAALTALIWSIYILSDELVAVVEAADAPVTAEGLPQPTPEIAAATLNEMAAATQLPAPDGPPPAGPAASAPVKPSSETNTPGSGALAPMTAAPGGSFAGLAGHLSVISATVGLVALESSSSGIAPAGVSMTARDAEDSGRDGGAHDEMEPSPNAANGIEGPQAAGRPTPGGAVPLVLADVDAMAGELQPAPLDGGPAGRALPAFADIPVAFAPLGPASPADGQPATPPETERTEPPPEGEAQPDVQAHTAVAGQVAHSSVSMKVATHQLAMRSPAEAPEPSSFDNDIEAAFERFASSHHKLPFVSEFDLGGILVASTLDLETLGLLDDGSAAEQMPLADLILEQLPAAPFEEPVHVTEDPAPIPAALAHEADDPEPPLHDDPDRLLPPDDAAIPPLPTEVDPEPAAPADEAPSLQAMDDNAYAFLLFMMNEKMHVDYLAGPNEIVLIDMTALDEASDRHYSRSWSQGDDMVITTIGHIEDFIDFGLL